MTHSRAKAFACLGLVIQLLANQVVQFVFDFVSIIIQIDSQGRLAQVRLLLNLDFEVTRSHTLLTFVARLAFLPIIFSTFQLVNCFILLIVGQMVFYQLVEGLVLVEIFKFVAFFDEVDWALLEELIINHSKERSGAVEIHSVFSQLDSFG